MRILIVDNFDSFTNNIADLLRGLRNEISVDVQRNDNYELLGSGQFKSYDAIIISPGPGNPAEPADLGISRQILAEETRPILGICLGHQAMALAAGGGTKLAPEPMHGRISEIAHTGQRLFAGLPDPLQVMRYHSWVVSPEMPKGFLADGWSEDGIIMGISALNAPRWGVQFHPESIGTDCGRKLLDNFLTLVESYIGTSEMPPVTPQRREQRALYWNKIGPALDPLALVEAQGLIGGRRPMLLDSSLVREGLSRFSIIEVPDADDRSLGYCVQTGRLSLYEGPHLVSQEQKSVFAALDEAQCEVSFPVGRPPFDFHGGLVGWLGYELKSELMGVTSWKSPTADAAFRFVNWFFVVDHLKDATYAGVCIARSQLVQDVDGALSKLRALAAAAAVTDPGTRLAPVANRVLQFTPRYEPDVYLDLIHECQRLIRIGESYELCLTNTITGQMPLDAWGFYKLLRKRNPSPYGAFLQIGDTEVMASSPERFLTVDGQGRLESKPIKGTARRGATPAEDNALIDALESSEKERAENIMIVDLVRHDFANVSIPGSIEVSKLFGIETFKSVHQMVSTIRGRLRPGLTCVDAIRATFPGGSMTGAPKIRSVEILDRLEQGPRGIYSGAIGWIGYGGQADLSIVIRTVVKQGKKVTVGCGGAITYLADPQAEHDEIMLKSQILLRALAEFVTGDAGQYTLSQHRVEAVV